MEYVNPLTGFRVDGRRPNEMRQLKGEVGVISRADDSALFEMGNTSFINAVYGPREVWVWIDLPKDTVFHWHVLLWINL
ncbi:exosome complex component RRP41 [Hordeum vulgare]|nr:exosome complex component RRP41 [Hordeum vulgare]